MRRKRYIVNGRVQGVGFRPSVYRMAAKHRLTGSVQNTSLGVVIEVQGKEEALAWFEEELRGNPPPLAEITRIQTDETTPEAGESGFIILESSALEQSQVLISPDSAVCSDCTREILDPKDRRYLYPFTNCTNCGPRYTITGLIPYDRQNTSMACFEMCLQCRREYSDPGDRRFHAQPNACPQCGPGLWLTDADGNRISEHDSPLKKSAYLLKQGNILAIKGLGGFHLACDAADQEAVRELRRRKNRPHKPLAVMVPDIAAAVELAELSPLEAEILQSPSSPILAVKPIQPCPLSPELAPDTDLLGIMLAYTPLHLVLFEHFKALLTRQEIPALVMTSGNMSSEPISLGNREALKSLGHIADYFLLHDRDILVRCDDSVMCARGPGPAYFRRARGYTPQPVFLSRVGPCILGTGPELKNTFCLTRNDQAFVSQHIGDLQNLESYSFYRECIDHLQHVLQVNPEMVVCDLHPDYLSTKYARQESGLPVQALQHHYAHILSVMAENCFEGPCLGLALDGAGLGDDGTLWGGELLLVDNRDMTLQRLGSFEPVPLPGGDLAVREPWRIAAGFIHRLGLEHSVLARDFEQGLTKEEMLLRQMLKSNINSPLSSGCGRLFDAVAALLGLVRSISYEGQAAVILEKIQSRGQETAYDIPVIHRNGLGILDTLTLFRQILKDHISGLSPAIISRRFHLSLVRGLCLWAAQAGNATGIRTIGLSGGVMHNLTLARELEEGLARKSFNVLTHRFLPPGDACVSLGQAVYGRHLARLKT
ncbi:carbamoyltransferase HypF [Desulfonatronospira sp. MSAO_Bac3]|uniref:carbamoyltransferase HypF n=1 Tax=Desulfonatronospira sp. MSAO_Bac3 TaxID=2293857 RepID=UPI000FF46ED1|nr:carbamoyltransferase HypF [Desulfonatronospira sp. MSAO_Bac3]RQD79414.1 MAG: carbamoyltransferase HypF [Desulfonatronospira sp. MSAO_Bac3]